MLLVRDSAPNFKNGQAYFDGAVFDGTGLTFTRDGRLIAGANYTDGRATAAFNHKPIDTIERADYIDADHLTNEDDEGYCDWLDLPQSFNGQPYGGVAFSFDRQGRCDAEYGFNCDGSNGYHIAFDTQGRRTEISIHSAQVSETYTFTHGILSKIEIVEPVTKGHNRLTLAIQYLPDGKVKKLHLEDDYFAFRNASDWTSLITPLPISIEEFSSLTFTADAHLSGSGTGKLL